jgi:hypothetical protein
MSADKQNQQQPSESKKHSFILPALSVVYLRTALNNPAWASGLDDWISGCDALRAVPKLSIPKDCRDDESVFTWSASNLTPFFLSDSERDSCRTALKKSFDTKALPINEQALALITEFALKK